MPVTPLHVAYVWPLKLRFRGLSFQALTIGSMVPDIENVVLFLAGVSPNRLVTHSLLGAFTLDVALTVPICYALHRLHVERIGVAGFEGFGVDSTFLGSTLIGTLTHILVDYIHHEFNPLLWPFGPTYLSGPLYDLLGYYGAHGSAQGASLVLLLYILRMLLRKNGRRLHTLLSKPQMALRIVTSSLAE